MHLPSCGKDDARAHAPGAGRKVGGYDHAVAFVCAAEQDGAEQASHAHGVRGAYLFAVAAADKVDVFGADCQNTFEAAVGKLSGAQGAGCACKGSRQNNTDCPRGVPGAGGGAVRGGEWCVVCAHTVYIVRDVRFYAVFPGSAPRYVRRVPRFTVRRSSCCRWSALW